MTILSILLVIAFFSLLVCLTKYLEQCKKYTSIKNCYDELYKEKFTYIENTNRMKRQIDELHTKLEKIESENEELQRQIKKLTNIAKKVPTTKDKTKVKK